MNDFDRIYSYIKKAPLFFNLDSEKLLSIAKSASPIQFKKDSLIIKKGDVANNLYLILEGSVQIYTKNQNDEHQIIAHLGDGDVFGEQAYLNNFIRSENVSAITDVNLIKIRYDILDAAFKKSEVLRQHLHDIIIRNEIVNFNIELQISSRYLIEMLTSPLFYHIAHHNIKSKLWRDCANMAYKFFDYLTFKRVFYSQTSLKYFKKDDIIFKKGDSFDNAYILISGQVVFSFNERKEDVIIQRGTLFGELSLLEQRPRLATARCKSSVVLICIGRSDFVRIIKNNPELVSYTEALKRHYELPKLHATAVQFIGKFAGEEAIFTTYKLRSGKKVKCIKVISQPIFKIHVDVAVPEKILVYKKGVFLFREIALANNRIVGLNAYGEWNEINVLCEVLLNEVKLNPDVLANFETTGELLSSIIPHQTEENVDNDDNTDIVCTCMRTTKKTIANLATQGVTTLKEVEKMTGAHTICGGCTPQILEILGYATTVYGEIKFKKAYSQDVYCYLIIPVYQKKLPAFHAGQFARVFFHINDSWIEGTYTLLPATHADCYEILIKKNPDDMLSSWLFANRKDVMLIKISMPAGNFILKKSKQPILCFAVDMGIAPYLAFIRAMKKNHKPVKMKIIHIKENLTDTILPIDVAEYIKQHTMISIEVWDTAKQGALTQEFIREQIANVAPELIYVCGEQAFSSAILDWLNKLKFPRHQITTEIYKS